MPLILTEWLSSKQVYSQEPTSERLCRVKVVFPQCEKSDKLSSILWSDPGEAGLSKIHQEFLMGFQRCYITAGFILVHKGGITGSARVDVRQKKLWVISSYTFLMPVETYRSDSGDKSKRNMKKSSVIFCFSVMQSYFTIKQNNQYYSKLRS